MNNENSNRNSQAIIENLRSENELKTQWLYLIAHDFKGLFSNMKTLLDMLENKSISQEMFINMLPEIREITEKNIKTLESTFDWINSQFENFAPHLENVQIYNAFLQLKDELDSTILFKELSIQYVGSQDLSLNTDRFLFMFILKQIVENAVKYSFKNGAIEVLAHSDSDEFFITIKDNGVGINQNIIDNLGTLNLSPYKGTMQEKGAGLSLVIVKEFLEKLNGQIKITSDMGEGTSVMLSFYQKQHA